MGFTRCYKTWVVFFYILTVTVTAVDMQRCARRHTHDTLQASTALLITIIHVYLSISHAIMMLVRSHAGRM